MKTMVLRLITFFAVALFALGVTAQDDVFNRDFGIGGGGGPGSCSVCDGSLTGGGMSLSCTSAEPGGWGQENCRIERYPEGVYCFTDGNDCCVD